MYGSYHIQYKTPLDDQSYIKFIETHESGSQSGFKILCVILIAMNSHVCRTHTHTHTCNNIYSTREREATENEEKKMCDGLRLEKKK